MARVAQHAEILTACYKIRARLPSSRGTKEYVSPHLASLDKLTFILQCNCSCWCSMSIGCGEPLYLIAYQ